LGIFVIWPYNAVPCLLPCKLAPEMPPENVQISKSPRILLVRLSAIGDVVQSMPMICALRERFPGAMLAWAVEQRAAELLEGHEAIDELIRLPRGWLKSPRGLWKLRRRLRNMRFDIAIDGQGLTKSAIVARLSGAPRRIGFGDYWGRELSRLFNTELVKTTGPHVVQRNLQLLATLGIDSSRAEFNVPQHQSDIETVDRIISEHGLADRFALLNTGAGWPSKLWPTERYAEVAAYLGGQLSLSSMVVWGGEGDRVRAEEIVAGSQGHAQLAPRTTLRVLAELSRRAALLVGSDTGPLHLAAAVGTPCVGLYGPWPAQRHGPYGPKNIALQEVYFEGSTRERRNAPPYFMQAITTKLVCDACDRIIDRGDRKAA
jgi:heptosyltransferase-1